MFDGDPHEVYFAAGWMKRYAEVLCRTYAEKIPNPMPTVVVRPSNVYGPYDKFDFAVSHVTAALIRRVVERHSPLEVWGNGQDIRDLVYVDDFIEGAADGLRRSIDPISRSTSAPAPAIRCARSWTRSSKVDGYDGADVRYDPSRPAPSRCA